MNWDENAPDSIPGVLKVEIIPWISFVKCKHRYIALVLIVSQDSRRLKCYKICEKDLQI